MKKMRGEVAVGVQICMSRSRTRTRHADLHCLLVRNYLCMSAEFGVGINIRRIGCVGGWGGWLGVKSARLVLAPERVMQSCMCFRFLLVCWFL